MAIRDVVGEEMWNDVMGRICTLRAGYSVNVHRSSWLVLPFFTRYRLHYPWGIVCAIGCMHLWAHLIFSMSPLAQKLDNPMDVPYVPRCDLRWAAAAHGFTLTGSAFFK